MPSNRLSSIDAFRGLAILTMVLANFMGGVQAIPPWLKHAPDVGLTVIDLIAPFFVFAIGLTYGLSFRRRLARDGAPAAYGHFLQRGLALLGLGALLSAGETLLGVNRSGVDWGVLQALGAATLVTLAVIRLGPLARTAIGVALLSAYQLLLDRFFLAAVLASPHGGLIGSISWSGMLILATVLADTFHDASRRGTYPLAVALTGLAGIGLALLSPLSKNRVSAAYVLVSLALSGLLFLLMHGLVQAGRLRFPLLQAWGRNPLLLYFLHYLLLGIFYLPSIPALYEQAPLWLAVLEMVFLVGVLSGVAVWLDRRQAVFSL